jgi:transcription elongation factor GreB
VSKAFTSEEAGDAPQIVRPRAPLPAGTANYVTGGGLRALHAELAELHARRVRVQANTGADQRFELGPLAVRIAELEARIASAVVMAAPATDRDVIRFGATVVVRSEDRPERVYRIVGVDEANAAKGSIAFVSPLARALLGKRAGDIVTVSTPRAVEELEVASVTYDPS